MADLIAELAAALASTGEAASGTFADLLARAALAQQEPQPVVDGEVAELVKWLRRISNRLRIDEFGDQAGRVARIAALLERHHPQPIPVSERLPGPDDLDAEGRVWAHMPDLGTAPSWRLIDPREIGPYHTHWLAAHDLPLPNPDPQP